MVGKREEIGRVTESWNLDGFAMCETILKGKGEVMFGGVEGRRSGVDVRIGGREGVLRSM